MRRIYIAALAAAGTLLLAAPAWAATGLPFDPDEATRQWLATMGPEATARSNHYFEGTYWIAIVGPLITIAVAMGMMVLGLANGVRTWLEKTVRLYIFVTAGMALFYLVVSSVFAFPFDYWTGFVREHAYGLSTQDFGHWFSEYLLEGAITLVIGSIAITGLYLIIAATKRSWWIWGTAATTAGLAVLIMLAPVFIAPRFNTYTPMADGPLKQSVLHIAQANGVPTDNVYQFDVSRQSHRVTANVSGFAGTTRISLSDTLVQRESPAGVRAVLGHEIGHYVLNHNISFLVMNAFMIVTLFALANALFGWLSKGGRWGVRSIWDPGGMPLFFAILTFLMLLATPIQNNITRFHEHQADMFGLNAAREPDGFAESALLLSEYRKMEPSPLEEFFFYDHPSGYERIHMSMVWKAHHMALGDIPMGPGGPPPGWRPDFVVTHDSATRAQNPGASPAARSN